MTRYLPVLILALAFGAAMQSAQAQRRATYTNPALAGDYPDPSVIRVGRDYWATATSSDWAPEFPLLHSRDLVNWEIVGAVFQKRPAWSVGQYWAPEISQDRGRFYIYYVGRKKDGPLCVAVATASKPTGPYVDHGPLVCQEVGSIDGFTFRDENGRRYLLWKEDANSVSKPTPIWAQPLSEDGTRLMGERKEILRNTEPWEKHATFNFGDLVEGPTIVRKNGWFYLFYSGNFCCGRECNYAVGVARSRKLLGPYEKNPANPILAGNENWKCPGHGTLVDDGRGRDYFLYHAYHPQDFTYVGRQAMLDRVEWGRDGWPTINQGRGPSASAAAPQGISERNAEYAFFDDFLSPRLRAGWQWPQANEPVVRIDRRRRGWLMLSPASPSADDPLGAVLARNSTSGDYTATVSLDGNNLPVGLDENKQLTGAMAGLAAYGDAENALGITHMAGKLIVWRREKKEHRVVAEVVTGGPSVIQLRMTVRDGHRYSFSMSRNDGATFSPVGPELDGSYLPPWDRGVRVALTAGGLPRPEARFGFLRIVPERGGTSGRE